MRRLKAGLYIALDESYRIRRESRWGATGARPRVRWWVEEPLRGRPGWRMAASYPTLAAARKAVGDA